MRTLVPGAQGRRRQGGGRTCVLLRGADAGQRARGGGDGRPTRRGGDRRRRGRGRVRALLRGTDGGGGGRALCNKFPGAEAPVATPEEISPAARKRFARPTDSLARKRLDSAGIIMLRPREKHDNSADPTPIQ